MSSTINEKKSQAGLTKNARFLFDLYLCTLQAIVDSAGLEVTIELMGPYNKFQNAATPRIFSDKFKLRLDDFNHIAVYLNYLFLFMGETPCNYQYFERGFTVDIHNCPMGGSNKDLCLYGKHVVEGMMPAINKDYEIYYTRMLIRGDPNCQIMVKKKNFPIWGEIAKKPLEVPLPEPSYEELEYWQGAFFSQSWIYSTNALVDFAGKEKAVEILRPYMKALGISIANDLSKELGIKDRDALAIASIIDRCNQAANQKGSYTYRASERADKEITACIFSNASQDICADALEARANGICEAINPLYEFHLNKRMCKGDKVCHWVIKKK